MMTTKAGWIYIADIDLTFDDTSETFTEMLEKLAVAVPSAFVKVLRMAGSGGGWPQGEAVVHSSEVNAFFEFFGRDESDLEYELKHTVRLEEVPV